MAFFPTEGGGIFGQGAFQIDQNSTPEMIQAKRAQLAALMPQYGRAKYVGEGIGQLATGIATGRKNKALDKFEGERRQEAAGMFNGIMSGQGAPQSGGPLSILGMRPNEQASPDQQVADDTMAAIGKPKQGGDREAFIQQMMPHAQRVAQKTGLDPRIVIAQAAQETGWGKSAPGNNYFGIKSHGKAGGNTFATNEVVDGQTVRINDSFRGYEGMGDSVDGYAEFLQQNPRYREMLSAGDLDGQLAALGKSGYATDPNYANSVGSIARSIEVPQGSFAPGPGTQVAQNTMSPQLNDLMMAAQNPWLTPQQRQVLNMQIEQIQGQQQMQQERQMRRDDAIFGQQLSQQDPMYQAKLDALQNPSPETTSTITEYNLAKSQGYDGTFQDYSLAMKQAGAGSTNVTVNGETGAKPLGTKGDILIPDPSSPTGYRVGQAAGSEAARAAEESAQVEERAESNRNASTSVITTAATRAREAAGSRQVGGLLGGVAAMNPSSQNAEVYRQNEVLKSNAKVENLNAMRAASKTGGALGSVTEKEAQMLADKSGTLDPASPNYLRDLDDYERTLLQVVHGFEEGNRIFDETRPTPDADGWQTVNGVKIRVKQ